MDDVTITHWAETALGHTPKDPALFRRALTHSSHGADNYERLEFLGDRVLGLIVSTWLYRHFADAPEGQLSMRFNALVSRETCAEVGTEIGVPEMMRLGKQARDDGAHASSNVIGDGVEALIGALYLEGGLAAAQAFVERAWKDRLRTVAAVPRHPKSALQEWAAAHRCKPPVYALADRSGPHHAPRFTVTVEVAGRGGGSASAEGASKQEAETEAAATLLRQLA
ncbi:ribonuclease-3 [Sphingomonas vulcanisoli]|uniref:Ribonuclease 3 n=1 Tax=Sphingomonas vulcanisoli TaxID=1658060 RepID=A0ABX0TLY1_9SPHN|nr:ribonuclease III [Sphingomonas vulcanisoli]NIJ06456.1 ribonuclease-3 [Sphingomonas vulcanisoli]